MINERLSQLHINLGVARPHDVAQAALRALRHGYDAANADILLVDYQLAHLIPVTPGRDEVQIEGSPAGQAFATQKTVIADPRIRHLHLPQPRTAAEADAVSGPGRQIAVHLPLTLYGDRLGILTLLLDRAPDHDELSALAAAADAIARALALADSRTDIYRRIRRRGRLTLAAEIQWELLPGRSYTTEEFDLAGQLEPAYAVWGDNFDWAIDADHLTVTVTNGMGQGIQAALLTQLTVGALRNARRSGSDLPDQAALASQAVYAQHRGEQHAGTLLLQIELATGRVHAIDAGSPVLYLLRDGAITPVELDQQLPLGLFNDTEYVTEELYLNTGDRLIILSDGVHTSLSPLGGAYGDTLPAALTATRTHTPSETVRLLTSGLLTHLADTQLADDAVIVCLDWTGQPTRPVIHLDTHRKTT